MQTFLGSTRLAGSEREMQAVPGFSKRDVGLHRFREIPPELDCEYCLHVNRRGKCKLKTPCLYREGFADLPSS